MARLDPPSQGDRGQLHRQALRLIEANPVVRRYSAFEGADKRLLVTRILPPIGPDGQTHVDIGDAVNALATARVQASHPAIAPIRSVRPVPGGAVELSEPMPSGITLRQLVERASPMRVDFVASLIWTVATALDKFHQLGWAHLGLTPDRIVIDAEGNVRLLDPGLGQLYRRVLPAFKFPDPRWEFLHPEPALTAPELLGSDKVGAPADVFALAGVAYFALSGGMPFTGRSAMEVYAQLRKGVVRPLHALRTDLSPALSGTFDQALRPFEDDRPESMPALARHLFGAMDQMDPLTEAVKAHVHAIPTVSYDARMTTVRDPEEAAGPEFQVGGGAGFDRLNAASQTLDALRASRRPQAEKPQRWVAIVVGLAIAAALALVLVRMNRTPDYELTPLPPAEQGAEAATESPEALEAGTEPTEAEETVEAGGAAE
jgi:serine/threonine-protein kinase